MNEKVENYLLKLRKDEGSRLKNERLRLGFNLGDFAKLLGVHRNTQRSYENGDRTPDDGYYKTASKLGVRLPYVINETDIEDLPAIAYQLASKVFTIYDTGFNAAAISYLFLILAKNHLNKDSQVQSILSEDMIKEIVKLAFEKGDVFHEACSAVFSYAFSIINDESSGQADYNLATSLITETITLYEGMKSTLENIEVKDGVRLAAEAVVKNHGRLVSK